MVILPDARHASGIFFGVGNFYVPGLHWAQTFPPVAPGATNRQLLTELIYGDNCSFFYTFIIYFHFFLKVL